MHRVEPKVFFLAETTTEGPGIAEYLSFLAAEDFKTDAPSEAEMLTEIMSRSCYKSFAPGLNPNVTRVREGNAKHLGHIIEVGHGSVTEHASVSFMFANVSRVFTHELVRHRVGTAMSQESLRFVRLTDLGFWLPSCIRENEAAVEVFRETIKFLETQQRKLAEIYDLDNPDVKFDRKKEITSAMRRIAPIGLATSIGWTANHRTLRHVLEMRTSPAAEEEIAFVFAKVGDIVKERYPNLYVDYQVIEDNGRRHFVTDHRKV